MITFLVVFLLLAGPSLVTLLWVVWADEHRCHRRAAFDAHADQALAITHVLGPDDDPTALRRIAIRAHLLATLPQPGDLCPHCGAVVIDPLQHHHLYRGGHP